MRRLNTKLIIGLVIGSVLFGTGVIYLHAFQVRNNAKVLLKLAEEAEEKGDLSGALKQLDRYNKHRPGDHYAICKLAILQADLAIAKVPQNRIRAWRLLLQARRLETTLDELSEKVRRRLITLDMLVGQSSDAIPEILALRQLYPKDAQLAYQLAECYAVGSNSRIPEAIKLCSTLIGLDEASGEFLDQPSPEQALDPKNVLAYDLLARMFRSNDNEHPNPALADKVIEQLIKANPKSPKAHLARAAYFQSLPVQVVDVDARNRARKANLAVSRREIETALELAPDDADVLVNAGQVALQSGDMDAAKTHFEKGMKQFPQDERMWSWLGHVQYRQMHFDQARKTFEDGLKVNPDRLELLVPLAEILVQLRDSTAAHAVMNKLDKMKVDTFQVQLLQARVLMLDGYWLQASKILEKLKVDYVKQPDLLKQVLVPLSDCYERMGQSDKQDEIASLILEIDPNALNSALLKASALLAQGKVDRALEIYEIIEQRDSAKRLEEFPAFWLRLLRLRMVAVSRKPVEKQDWSRVDEMLAAMKARHTTSEVEWSTLAAEVAMRKGKLEDAEKIILDAQRDAPNSAVLWVALYDIYRKTKYKDDRDALAVIEQAERQTGDQVSYRMARLSVWTQLGGEEAKAEIAKLAARSTDVKPGPNQLAWSDADQTRWLETLAYSQRRVGDHEQARKTWRELRKFRGEDINYYTILFQLARESQDENEMQLAIDQMRRLGGKDDAQLKLAEATRLANRVVRERTEKNNAALKLTAAEAAELTKARKLLEEARGDRGGWYSIYQVLADIEMLQGDREKAIENLRKAADLGPADQAIVRQLISLLTAVGRYSEALPLFERLGPNRTGTMGRTEADLRVQMGEFKQAIKLAQRLVPEESSDALSLFWRATLLNRCAQPLESERFFRLAVNADPSRPEVWLGLVDQLMKDSKKNEALKALAEADTQLPSDRKPLTLAQGYERAGDIPAAEKNFLDAQSARPSDFNLANSIASFYLRYNRIDDARKQFQWIVDKAPADQRLAATAARRALAQLKASSREYADHLAALEMVKQNADAAGKLADEDEALIAELYAARQDATSRQLAVTMLEAFERKGTINFDQRLTLATLYEQLGRWNEAARLMDALRSQAPDNLNLLSDYVQMLLRNNELAQAENLVKQIEAKESNGKPTVRTTALRSLILAKQDRKEEATRLITQLVSLPQPIEKRGDVLAVARLLDEMGIYDVSIEYFTAFDEMDHSPLSTALLAAQVGQHRLLAEALDLCEKQLQGVKDVATAMPLILSGIQTLNVKQGEAQSKHFEQVEKWIFKLRDRNPDSELLTARLCDLYQLWGKSAAAEKEYRAALARDKIFNPTERALLKNNFGYLLALEGKDQDYALSLLDEALKTLGPMADLLDTRGMLKLSQKRYDEALADFKTASLDRPQSGAYLFHQALALHAAGKNDLAQRAMKSAEENGLYVKNLPKLEQVLYDKLQANLKK